MVNKPNVIWSTEAKKDLKNLHEFYTFQSKSYADKTVNKIFSSIDNIIFIGQYQEDEFLGLPFRRLFVNHVRISYEVSGNNLTIYRLFDTRRGLI
jgi:plasmid stabilization system protein ParE